MSPKPQHASGYLPTQTILVRKLCLYVATKLGDLCEEIVVIGGLVPSLIVDLREDVEPHTGTMDLDLGLGLALLDASRYKEVAIRLRDAGFAPDRNDRGVPIRQRWRFGGATLDFLIAPTLPTDKGGRLRDLEPDFAAFIIPGLHLAFADRLRVRLQGTTIRGEVAEREMWVCGPGAYTVLKALAFDGRGENKDAYDLFYVLQYFGTSIADVHARLVPLIEDSYTQRGLEVLARDFLVVEGVGPRRVADFVHGAPNPALQADVVGAVRALLARCGR